MIPSSESPTCPTRPRVSIILPTYNRVAFLPQAIASIRSQTFTDWELVVVDDGSTDGTRSLIRTLTWAIPQPVHYVYQANAGAYSARNKGLQHAAGSCIAFFDSDDVWQSHHLANSITALDADPDVDWVYGACRRVDSNSGRVLTPHSFYVNDQPRPFLSLRTRQVGDLRVIDDANAMRCMIQNGFYCGLQTSVLRRRVFESLRFHTTHANEAEDQVFVVRALAAGFRIGYLNHIHVDYHVHDAHSSAAGNGNAPERQRAILQALIQGYEELRQEVSFNRSQRRALDRRISREYFWTLGYATLWQHDRRHEAIECFRRGLRLWPSNARYWKTYLWARVRRQWKAI